MVRTKFGQWIYVFLQKHRHVVTLRFFMFVSLHFFGFPFLFRQQDHATVSR